MQFCKKCGALVLPRPGQKLICGSCGEEAYSSKMHVSEKIIRKEKVKSVIEEADTLPIVDGECPKCPNKKAQFWTIHMRGTDEPDTHFFKCTKCEHTWREY